MLLLASTSLVLNGCALIHNKSAAQQNALKPELTTHLGDHPHFIQGDDLQLLLSLNQSAYVLLLYQDANQQVWQLYPNQIRSSAKLGAGEFQNFPSAADNIKLTVGPPYGKERAVLFASNKPLPKLGFTKIINGMQQLKLNLAQIESTLRTHAESHDAYLSKATTELLSSKD